MTAIATLMYGAARAPFDVLAELRALLRRAIDEIGGIVRPLLANLSDYMEDALGNWMRGTTFPAAPSNTYLALFTTATNDTSGGTEVSGNNYSRTTLASTIWSAPSGGQISNSTAIISAVASGSWGTITHIAIHDASSGGNRIWHGALTSSVAVASGEAFYIAPGALTLTVA